MEPVVEVVPEVIELNADELAQVDGGHYPGFEQTT